jgi:hypothetical protein
VTAETMVKLDNPPLVEMKNVAWKAITNLLQSGETAPPSN